MEEKCKSCGFSGALVVIEVTPDYQIVKCRFCRAQKIKYFTIKDREEWQ